MGERPNVVVALADQMRAGATGYSGDPNAQTPRLDALARRSVNVTRAVSCCPVCTPYRACLMTGQYPLTHGLVQNDLCLGSEAVSLAEAFAAAGYRTAYLGKWHLDGHGRRSYTPPERRNGFQFWKALECTHDYFHGAYYADEDPQKRFWDGYDAYAQTREACRYIRRNAGERPFLLVLSWGPPHNPYQDAPQECRELYSAGDLELRPNVPPAEEERAREDLAGYYAHVSALDRCVGELVDALREAEAERDTLFLFTSDHGDMLGSQGAQRKQRPYDESIRVPFLLHYPDRLGQQGRETDLLINSPDVMPTLLGLCGLDAPATAEGLDYSDRLIRGDGGEREEAALVACYCPFGEWAKAGGGREYRGVRTRRYTYVRDLDGPWLLFDNREDPFQLRNLADDPESGDLHTWLEGMLREKLAETGDEFRTAEEYIDMFGYEVDETGTVPYGP